MATPKPLSLTARNGRAKSPVPDLPASASFLHNNGPTSPNSSSSRMGSGSTYFGKPLTPTLSQTSSDTFVDDVSLEGSHLATLETKALQANAKAIQDRIARLTSGTQTPTSDFESDSPSMTTASPRAKGFSSPVRSSFNMPPPPTPSAAIRRLEAKISELEAELEAARASGSDVDAEASALLKEENATLQTRLTALQAQIELVESTTREEKAALSARLQDSQAALDKLREEGLVKEKEASSRAAELEAFIVALREDNEKQSAESLRLGNEGKVLNDELNAVKETLAKTTAKLEADKVELAQEVDELRLAGQVRSMLLSSMSESVHVSYSLQPLYVLAGNYRSLRRETCQRRGHPLRSRRHHQNPSGSTPQAI